MTKVFFTLEPFGLLSEVGLPLPIPNRVVKRFSANNSYAARRSEDRSRPEDSSVKYMKTIVKEITIVPLFDCFIVVCFSVVP